MGKNWIHLEDGTGAAGSNDLTVTTKVMPRSATPCWSPARSALDKDFGYGYKYDVILEDAQVTVENKAHSAHPK